MALETGTFISDLVSTNPASSDNISQGDDHIRLLKATIKATFPNVSGAVTPTHTDLNKLVSTGTPTFGGLALESTDADAAAGPTLNLFRNSASPAANDVLGQIVFSGDDSGGNYANYAFIVGELVDPTNGSEDGALSFLTTRAGTVTPAMRIDNLGNVGIATTAPEYPLDVTAADNHSTTSALSIQNASRNYGLGLGAYQLTNRNIGGVATNIDYTFDIGGASIFRTANAERMRITTTGAVGIGTSSPLIASGYGWLTINGPSAGAATSWQTAGTENFRIQSTGFGTTLNNLTSVPLLLQTNNLERMRIREDGNVGIGTSGGDYSKLMIKNDRAVSTYSLIVDNFNGVNFENSFVLQYDSTGTQSVGNYQAANLAFLTNNQERMRVTAAGNVGIAVTSPSWPLTVNGDIRAIGSGNILVNGTGLIGYGSGAGGTVTQATSRTTAVTLNKASGRITLVSAAATTAWTTFTVNNSLVSFSDSIILTQRTGARQYNHFISNVTAGSFDITFAAVSGTTTEQPSFSFTVLSGQVA